MLSRKVLWRAKHSPIVSSPSQRPVSTAIVWASRAICATLLILAATTVVRAQTPTEAARTQQPGVCPVFPQLNPPSASTTLNVPKYNSYRPLVSGDYVVIEYNASQKKVNPEDSDPNAGLTSWTDYKRIFDYRRLNNRTNIIETNGSFLPVIDTKEKIAVRVCGLHFTDVLTVTTSPNGVPEGGADIRGATPVTPPAALSSTLDMLQSGVATGGTTNLPGLGLNAPTQVPSLSVSGITPGSLGAEDQTPGKYPTYTPANITASGRQVALLLYSVAANAKELTRLIGRTEGKAYPAIQMATKAPMGVETPGLTLVRVNTFVETEKRKLENDVETGSVPESDETAQAQEPEKEAKGKAAPGSVQGLAFIVNKVLGNVKIDDRDNNTAALDTRNSAGFDKDMTDIQNLNAQISTLATALSSQAFASNTITLLNNYSALIGTLDLANLARNPEYCEGIPPALQPGTLSADDLKKLTMTNLGNLTLSQVKGLNSNQIKQIQDNTLKANVQSIQAALKVLKYTNPANDKPLCSAFENQKITDFWKSYNDEVAAIIHEIANNATNPDRDADVVCNTASGLSVVLDDPYMPDPDPKHSDKFGTFAACRLAELSEKLDVLRGELRGIDEKTTELYNLMNEWYFRSSVEQTDLLPPLVSSGFVRISIVVQRGYTPFTLANASGTFTPTATTNALPTSTTASTSTPAHAVKTILVEVHRVANFNLMGGVMLIHIPTGSYAVQASPTAAVATSTSPTGFNGTCGGKTVPVPTPATPPASGQSFNYACIIQTQKTDWQVAGMAGITWFPWGHDYFPRHSGYANFGRNLLPSLLVATSVTSLGNSMGAVNWEPVSGLDFFAGIGSAHRTSLPNGLTVNTPVAAGTTLSTVTSEHVGLTLGLGFDLNTIITLFSAKSTSVASMP
jgi:hypothetical protein